MQKTWPLVGLEKLKNKLFSNNYFSRAFTKLLQQLQLDMEIQR